jgi:hypothetical protein
MPPKIKVTKTHSEKIEKKEDNHEDKKNDNIISHVDINQKIDSIIKRLDNVEKSNLQGKIDTVQSSLDAFKLEFLDHIPKQFYKIQLSYAETNDFNTVSKLTDLVNFFFRKRSEFLPTFALWDWTKYKSSTQTILTINFLFRLDKPVSIYDFRNIILDSAHKDLYINGIEDGVYQLINYIKYYKISNKLDSSNPDEGANIWKVGGDSTFMIDPKLNDQLFTNSSNYSSDINLQLYFKDLIETKNWFKLFTIKAY